MRAFNLYDKTEYLQVHTVCAISFTDYLLFEAPYFLVVSALFGLEVLRNELEHRRSGVPSAENLPVLPCPLEQL